MRNIFLLFIILLCLNESFPEIRYVSKTGTSIPPYTSWETAADSIFKCINISSFGDTIYVANGVYKEKVVMIPGLSLIGAGMDSCVIDVVALAITQPRAISMADSCLVQGFKLLFDSTKTINGTGFFFMNFTDSIKGCIVLYNSIFYATNGMYITEGIVKNNFIYKSHTGIICAIYDGSREYIAYIDSNYISYRSIGIQVLERTKINVRNNIFYITSNLNTDGRILSNSLSGSSTPDFINNLITSRYNIEYRRGIENAYPGSFTNNVFLAKFENAFYSAPVTIKNNVLIGSKNAVAGTGHIVEYNNFWRVENYPADSTNISVDPMFVNDSTDFHLQMYSQMIDAGDPSILDKDGSRSDIGLYGGPSGYSYPYQDLPPRIPVNFSAEVDSPQISFSWNKNTESDFKSYRLYRDTIPDFNLSTLNMISELQDTFYTDIYPPDADRLYYKVTSVDQQLNESEPSEEISLIINSINETELLMRDYIVYQNYPNPFNPSTKIGYRISKRSYVKIYVYDITGSELALLVNEEKNPGYYETEFIPDDLASGIYLYRTDISDSEKRVPVHSELRKMVYQK